MNWIATPKSSNIAGYGYVKETQVLTVEFNNDRRYNYYDVLETLFEQMKAATSRGQFLAQNIKGRFRYARA